MINNKKTGTLTVYAAPMFGGKTTNAQHTIWCIGTVLAKKPWPKGSMLRD